MPIHADNDNLAASAKENLNLHACVLTLFANSLAFSICVSHSICTSYSRIEFWLHMHGSMQVTCTMLSLMHL